MVHWLGGEVLRIEEWNMRTGQCNFRFSLGYPGSWLLTVNSCNLCRTFRGTGETLQKTLKVKLLVFLLSFYVKHCQTKKQNRADLYLK